MDRMYQLGPEFVDVTWGAGGSTSNATLDICTTAARHLGLETCMHLTCTNMHKDMIDHALKVCKDNGIQNILALRGDPPKGQERWEAVEGGFSHAVDLVRYIRQEYGDYFGIGVAGYPEGHLDNEDKEADLMFLKEKIDAGADYIITQLFYDVDLLIDFVARCRAIGITCPILPGVMPLHTYAGWKRMTTLCKTAVPEKMANDLEAIKDDDEAVKAYGERYCTDMIVRMQQEGITFFHFYTLNLEASVRNILEKLRFDPTMEKLRPLPWKQSLGRRENENVRPIFWQNRCKSYVNRTETWDEFPNGRWGSSQSPAFGELDGYGVSIKLTQEQVLSSWGTPESVHDLAEVFINFLQGNIKSLPWCDEPLALESGAIVDCLAAVNRRGCLTVNSQPAVNAKPSGSRPYGWGPSNGYVYQKGYLEFFVAPDHFDALLKRIDKEPYLTYFAVDASGKLRTNSKSPDRPNAVTWGVFPGSEIIQPTIVELTSFLAWKDEAFQLWHQWARCYEKESATAQLMNTIANSWLLVNLVDNDYVNGDIFSIFKDE